MNENAFRDALAARMEIALRRAGGIPKLAQTPEGRDFLLKSCAVEAMAAFADAGRAALEQG